MLLGIDFGTTRTRVAVESQGSYSLVEFRAKDGFDQDWYPSLIAARRDEALFGLEARAVQYDADWELCRSFKRLLNDGHPQSVLRIGGIDQTLLEWFTQYLRTLREHLLHDSSLEVEAGEPLRVIAGVPTNANSNQRFLTLEGFRRAGFEVLGMLNEPSAAGIEFSHHYQSSRRSHRNKHLVVYDLGGGTFDVSVIRMTGLQHDVVGSEGIARLGGDDFDELLLELALDQPTVDPLVRKNLRLAAGGILIPPFSAGVRSRMLNLCREAKESIGPATRRISVDFSQLGIVSDLALVPIDRFYEKCQSVIASTIEATESALNRAFGNSEPGQDDAAHVYLVGGSCDLPVLARALKQRFGKRVRRSPYPAGATATGLVLAGAKESGIEIKEQFSRFFGVWRENDSGAQLAFDPIFAKNTVLPGLGDRPLVVTRRYRPMHNIGHLRFLECSRLAETGQPQGDIISWDEVYFPYDPALIENTALHLVPVERWPGAQSHCVEETYRCDAQGIIEVTIVNATAGYSRQYRVRQTRGEVAKRKTAHVGS
ncbi:MAG: Hsp70 family protein [Acidobacteriota bacterium]